MKQCRSAGYLCRFLSAGVVATVRVRVFCSKPSLYNLPHHAAWAYNYQVGDLEELLDRNKDADRMPLAITSAWDGDTLRHASG